jgi:hypothetical protein
MIEEPQILIPFHRSEAIQIAEAAAIAGRSVRTMREWCCRHNIGRRICGQWSISKIALVMLLEGNWKVLEAYLSGDRVSPLVVSYFERCGVPLPRQGNSLREGRLSEVKTRVDAGIA